MDKLPINKDEVLKDSFENLIVNLPLQQIAGLYCISKSYVTKICRQNGLEKNKQTGTLTVPLRIIRNLYYGDENGNPDTERE